MLGSSFLAHLAGGELGLDPAPVPHEIPTDEHGWLSSIPASSFTQVSSWRPQVS